MATWMVHLKIAENIFWFLKEKTQLYDNFFIGSIAPDCGKPTRNPLVFNPPKQITHFTPTGEKSQCDYFTFAEHYIKNENNNYKKSFYLGYFSHLVGDVLWSEKIVFSIKNRFNIKSFDDSKLLKKIKDDWFALDFLLAKNESYGFNVLKNVSEVEFENIYFNFYSDHILLQLKNIVKYYENITINNNKEYKYLNKIQLDEFIIESSNIIIDLIRDILKI
ncbi:MAG: zinc dependent phospholipase C family protein [Oscillospiraceae bacterium]